MVIRAADDTGLTPAQVTAMINSAVSAAASSNLTAMTALIPAVPQAAQSAPPSVGGNNVKGSAPRYALEDHTHATSVQRKIISTAIVSGESRATWTFNPAYAAGITPVVEAITLNTSSQPYNVEIYSCDNTQVTFRVWKANPTTLGATLIAIAGTVITPFIAAGAGVSLHCMVAPPTP